MQGKHVMKRVHHVWLIVCMTMGVSAGPTWAEYPDKPLRLIVPFPEAGAPASSEQGPAKQ